MNTEDPNAGVLSRQRSRPDISPATWVRVRSGHPRASGLARPSEQGGGHGDPALLEGLAAERAAISRRPSASDGQLPPGGSDHRPSAHAVAPIPRREKVTLLWDGLPAHRSRDMQRFLASQRHWLVIERLPGYAPELHPLEAPWANLKGAELANLTADTLDEVTYVGGHARDRPSPPDAHLPFRSCATVASRRERPSTCSATSLIKLNVGTRPDSDAVR